MLIIRTSYVQQMQMGLTNKEEEQVTFRLATLSEDMRERLNQTFTEVENRLKMAGIGYTLYYVVLELIGNAVRANLKRVYFQENGYNIADSVSYAAGLEAFRREMMSILETRYAETLEKLDFVVNVRIDIDRDRLLIYVENNCTLQPEEEARIRKNLANTREIRDIMEFSLHYGDDSEGKGLGLAMIVLLMKDLGFDPSLFRVFRGGGKTTARLEFPLSLDYTPIRNRGPYQEKPPGMPSRIQ